MSIKGPSTREVENHCRKGRAGWGKILTKQAAFTRQNAPWSLLPQGSEMSSQVWSLRRSGTGDATLLGE